MNYKIRLTVFKALELFPRKVADFLYLKIQSLFGNANVARNFVSGQNGIDKCKETISALGWDRMDAIIEIGSGWYPATPLLLVKEFANCQVYTYDINSFYSAKSIQQSNAHMGIESKGLIPEIHYYPNTDLTKCSFPDFTNQEVMVYSKFVLEHIPNDVIKGIHENIIDKIGTHKVFHWISPSDHRFFTDASLSIYDFLKFSETEWLKNHTKFDYHNRTRLPEYVEIFKSVGYTIETLKYNQPNEKVFEQFRQSKVDERFKHFTAEENLAGSIVLALTYTKK